jgi:hypothetical protein
MIEPMQVVAVARLGQHDAVRPPRQHRSEVGQGIGTLDRIDAHPERYSTRHA